MRVNTDNPLVTRRNSRLALIGATLAGLAIHAAPAAGADAPDPLNDAWELSLGMYAVEANTDVTLDGNAGEQGAKVDWAFNGVMVYYKASF